MQGVTAITAVTNIVFALKKCNTTDIPSLAIWIFVEKHLLDLVDLTDLEMNFHTMHEHLRGLAFSWVSQVSD